MTVAQPVVLDDATLVARARDGDVRAYEELVRRNQGPMFRLATRMLSSRTDAEDVVQEVFLIAWRRIGQLQDGNAFVGWLYRTTTNRCLNVIRLVEPSLRWKPTNRHPRRVVPNGLRRPALSCPRWWTHSSC